MDIEELKDRLRTNWICSDPQIESVRAAANDAADAIDRLQHENKVRREEMRIERARNEWLIATLSHIHNLLLPEGVVLPDGRRFEFSNPEIEREMLRGLAKAIRAIPEEIEKSKTQKPKEW